VPGAVDEDPLLRVAAEELFGDDGFACSVAVLQNAQFIKQHDEGAILLKRRGKIVRPPRAGDSCQDAALRCPSGGRFQLEHHEVVESGTVQAPRGRQPGDTAADDHDANLLPAVGGGNGAKPVAQAMPDAG
jgi:hypothetical protein